jgi:predicted dehydrogenase
MSLEKKLGLKIQVGHIERFNAAFTRYMKYKKDPVFIESHRLCAYNERGLDVDVILDLMIHDIDLILTINPYKIKSIHASGSKILTESLDMANARIEFINNVTANLTASRISLKQMRQMRVFEKASYNVLDFQKQSLNKWSVKNGSFQEKKINAVPTNALFDELLMFIDCIKNNSKTQVGTKEGFQALKIASSIQKTIEKK